MAATVSLTAPNPLISYHTAIERLLEILPPARQGTRPLQRALGCVAAADVLADLDQPPFRKSFMDGYALRSADVERTPATLECIGEVAAGNVELPRLEPGQCVAIMTGAAVPPDADAVQMVEKTRREADRVVILDSVEAGAHVADQGSELRRGERVIEAGRYLGPPEIGVLASFGAVEVEIWEPPTVAIVPTGDELVAIQSHPAFGQIRNSSALMLEAQCRLLGLEVGLQPVARDSKAATRRAFEAARWADLILFTGGVSMGEHDYVHGVLAEEGVELIFHKAAIKPGKPLLVGRDADRIVIGLPGNPVSSFVTFELFVRPAVQRWQGLENVGLPIVPATLAGPVRKRGGRLWFMPARAASAGGQVLVHPVPTGGSADLTAFARANCLAMIPPEARMLEAGESVDVLLLEGRQP